MTATKPTEELQRITVSVPKGLLEEAREQTGEGITQTVTAGLERLAVSKAYRRLLALKGKGNLELDIDAARQDREFS